MVGLFQRAVSDGSSLMATATAPQFGWVENCAKVALLAGATFTGAASAGRGRSVRRTSLRDGLTGLLNRHAFDRCIAHLPRDGSDAEQVLARADERLYEAKRGGRNQIAAGP